MSTPTVTVTIIKTVPAALAASVDLPTDRQSVGSEAKLRSEDAAELVTAGYARFGAAAKPPMSTLGQPRLTVKDAVAAVVASPDLRAAYGPHSAVRCVVNGESHAKGATSWWESGAFGISATEPLAWAHLLSGGRLQYIYNAGVGSTSTSDALTRMATVASYKPDVVLLVGGTYDTDPANAQGVTFAQYKTNVASFITQVRAMGALPVVSTVLPYATNSARMRNIETWNIWLRAWCAANAVPLLDSYAILVDPATGGIQAALTSDNLHANAAGDKLLGQALVDLLAARLAPYAATLPQQSADTGNLFANGLFLTDTNADGLADSWSKTANMVATRVTGDTAIKGNWQRFADSDAAQGFVASNVAGGTWAVGERLAFCGRIAHHVGTSNKAMRLQLNFTGGTPNSAKYINLWNTELASGTFYHELVIPAGTTGISLNLYREAGTQGDGWTQLAQMGLYNLTRLAATL